MDRSYLCLLFISVFYNINTEFVCYNEEKWSKLVVCLHYMRG